MKKTVLMTLSFLFILNQSVSASLSKHIVDYRIKARLVPEEKAVAASETLTWLNDSEVPISELRFHLYLNAFKNNRSTFMKESGHLSRDFKKDEKNWGYNKVRKIGIKEGVDLTASIEYIQPDDGNKDDQTVMRLSLPEPIPPQGKITLEIEFYAKLPKVIARSGFFDNFFMVAQWFPKIGVLQDGEWNCHQYHRSSEFFADFGVYEVEITVPREYVVGASGKRMKEVDNSNGTKTCTHYQEDIHDFAWTACPDFMEFHELYTLENPPVKTEIILLIHRSHLKLKDIYLSSLKNGIEFYSQNYGAYPYPTITLVDPPLKGLAAGGMEYPTLFTTFGASFLPKGLLLSEMVTIHEFGHNYWYGMVASNEFEEAWLDEGLNSYSEIKAMARYYGEDQSMIKLGPLKISDLDLSRLQVMATAQLDPIVKNSWEFYSSGSYATNTYQKAALTLLTLENYLGQNVMAKIMRTYFERWKFKHPTTKDFIAVAEDVSGHDLGWFFDQFLWSPDKLDYAIGALSSEEVKDQEGIFNGQFKTSKGKKEKGKEKVFKNEVNIVRKGELIFPQEILIIFENGEKILAKWDGRTRWKRFVYYRPNKLESACVDPEHKVVVDVNYMNNSRLLKPSRTSPLKYALEMMLDFQKILTLISL